MRPIATPSCWAQSRTYSALCLIDATSFSTSNTSPTFSAVKRNGLLACSSVARPVEKTSRYRASGRSLGSSNRTCMIASGEGASKATNADGVAGAVPAGDVDLEDFAHARVTRIVPLTFLSGTRSNGFSDAVIIGMPISANRPIGLTLTLVFSMPACGRS